MRRSLRPILICSFVTLLAPFGLGACGTSGESGAIQGVPNYFVLPVDPKDQSGLPPAINDPGSDAVDPKDCAANGYDIAVIDDYEGGKAIKTYTFNDSTSDVYPLSYKAWEPSTTPIPKPRGNVACGPGYDSKTALHIAGVYKDFGGGVGTVLMNHVDSLNRNPQIQLAFTDLNKFTIDPLKSAATPILFWNGTPPNAPGIGTDPAKVDFPYVAAYAGNTPLDATGVHAGAAALMQSVDLNDWEGITFWARRGAFAGPGFRPGILDRTTSDDFNKQLPPDKASCRSIYTQCGCQNMRPCTHWDPAIPGTPVPTQEEINSSVEPLVPTLSDETQTNVPLAGDYCWDPKLDKYPPWDPSLRCGNFACDFHPDTPIPAMTYNPVSQEASELWHRKLGPDKGMGIGTMTCSPEPYTFRDSTTPAARYCYRPGIDADPPEKNDRCNDGFLSGVLLDTNWRRYYVPFADLRQGNVDQHSKGIDLHMVESFLISFPGGNLDLWIDDPAFYRKKK